MNLTCLNQVVSTECHTLPSVEQKLGCLRGEAKVFSKLEATVGFHQAKLSEETEELTSFITLFGICSTLNFFQCQMSRVLEGLDGVVSTIGNILIFGNTQAEHD